jgi:precorrin-2 dehydrogenase / sirohydrochlorin ferrochelatase
MNGHQMSPVFVSPGNRRIVVFGGGKVALRKCLHFAGFRITVVADAILPELEEIADESVVRHIDAGCVGELSSGAWMVIAATDSKELNGTIRDTAMGMGILTNSAHGGGDVLIPSVLDRDGFTITASTGGRVPAFPPYLIKKIDSALDGSFDLMLDLLVRLRPASMDGIPTQQGRAAFLADVLDDATVWGYLRMGDVDSAEAYALEKGGLS